MPDVDERIRTELASLSRPVSVDGVLERVAKRKSRRRVVRRVQALSLAAVVVAGSVAGGIGLTRLFGHAGTVRIPGASSQSPPTAVSPNPTSAGGSPSAEEMICDQTQLSADVDGDGVLDQVDVYSPSPVASCDAPEVGQRYVLHVSGGKEGPSGPGVRFYGADTDLPECQQPFACKLFAAPDVNDDGAAEIAVEVKQEGATIYFHLYELEGLDTAGGPHFVRIGVADQGDPTSASAGDLIPFAWGGDADRFEAVECRGDGPDRILVASNAVPSAGDPGRYDVHEVQLSYRDGALHVEATADYPNLVPDQNPPFVTPSTLCGSPLVPPNS